MTERCGVIVEIAGEGYKDESEVTRAIDTLTAKLGAFGQGEKGPAASGNGYAFVGKFQCNGSYDCLVEKLKKMGILKKVNVEGDCPKLP